MGQTELPHARLPRGPAGAFSLEPGAAYGALLGGIAKRGPGAGRRLVTPGEVDTLRAWIAQGASGE